MIHLLSMHNGADAKIDNLPILHQPRFILILSMTQVSPCKHTN